MIDPRDAPWGLVGAGEEVGRAVGGLGDVDGDGVPDLLVGVVARSDEGTLRGGLYVVLLHSNGSAKAVIETAREDGTYPPGLPTFSFMGKSMTVLGRGVLGLPSNTTLIAVNGKDSVQLMQLYTPGDAGAWTSESELGQVSRPVLHITGPEVGYSDPVGSRFEDALGWVDVDQDGAPELLIGTPGLAGEGEAVLVYLNATAV